MGNIPHTVKQANVLNAGLTISLFDSNYPENDNKPTVHVVQLTDHVNANWKKENNLLS